MTTALDTSVLLDVLVPDERYSELSAAAIETAATAGVLVVCDVVYAELSVYFPSRRECDDFLGDNEIQVESLGRDALFLASRVWRTYRKQGGTRQRILPDFLIGGHAQVQAARLVTRDRGFYRSLFPELVVADPSFPSR